MSPIREQLATVIDCLPEAEQGLLLEIARRFMVDDVATEQDIIDIKKARAEYAAGETVSHSAIDWD